MNKLFVEFENENVLTYYPFASGCAVKDTDGNHIGTGILIDAALYPVNATGILYLSSISPGGIVSISDETGVVMTATYETGATSLEFYDLSGLSRHVGTLLASSADALSLLVNVSEGRKFTSSETAFASTCVFPIVNDGVMSLNVNKTGQVTGDVTFLNSASDEIRVSTNGSNLRFDVIPNLVKQLPTSIQHIYCIVDGKTPFRIQKMPFGYSVADGGDTGNTVAVYLDNISRTDVCNNAHRENSLEMADTCHECEESSSSDCWEESDDPVEIPDTYQVVVIDIPNNAENAFYLAVPNLLGYDNPLSITLTDGVINPKLNITVTETIIGMDTFEDNLTSKGAILQVPGLSK